MLRRSQQYSAVDESRQEEPRHTEEPVQWYWTAAGYLTSWLLAGGLLMLPNTFDNSVGFRVTRTFLSVFAVALITAGLCFTVLLMMAVRSWAFRANSLLLPAFSSCLLGTLTILYGFGIQNRYMWNIAGVLSTLFATLLLAFYGMFMIFAQRCAALDRATAARPNIPLQHTNTAYDGYQAHDPSPTRLPPVHNESDVNYYKGHAQPLDAITRAPSNAAYSTMSGHRPRSVSALTEQPSSHTLNQRTSTQTLDPFAHTLDPRPSSQTLSQHPSQNSLNNKSPDPSTLTEEELMRQQMLMLLMTKPEDALAHGRTGRSRADTGYRIDWENEADTHSPAFELAAGDQYRFHKPDKAMQEKLLAAASAGKLPPGYFERNWDGVWRKSSDLQNSDRTQAHPAFRESRFIKTGGDREARRKEIERLGTRSYRGST
ncbi:hypothetical protein K461DRAFT_282873 [Myriangium duriaei CBS 260.36]|uniref:Uncharacterized protein n=1 Tax=Myriangium duriaei CBS 260.36 TaxID=1168546 RepID=A0A9P4ITW2_9PEZI|nr:hypothetical protein K461DRAFT_282873 [Myriangium duriaei CBS 260.36]